jgi:hypothetical protein
MFAANIYNELAMPEFNATLLGLELALAHHCS